MFKLASSALKRFAAPQMTRQYSGKQMEYTVGSCGILPFEIKKKNESAANDPSKARFKLPDHLIRPPCIPGSKPGKEQTCLLDNVGMYCVPNRIKYKYPSFSENMDAIPGDGKVCWWSRTPDCPLTNPDPMFYDKPDVEFHA